MTADVQEEIRVERPRAEVCAQATDWRDDTEWIGASLLSRAVRRGVAGI